MSEVASAYKIAYHKEKIDAYLKGEPIFPVTVELDITSRCTRVCPDCPSCRSEFQHSLPMRFVNNLFTVLEGRTKGLLLTGGEPTMSPSFPETLALARKSGFEEIAIVTNGSLLHEDAVVNALIRYATTIRISMYDWTSESCGGIKPVLEKIRQLRMAIDQGKSSLKIGVSVLTSRQRLPRLKEIADAVRDAGAHWAYYHPMCTGWESANLMQEDQTGVLNAINEYRQEKREGFEAFISPARYANTPIFFNGYHAAHFMLVIGADGVNYLGAEVKYQNRFAIADLTDDCGTGFLHRPERLERINAVTSTNYSALHSRHRGVLYNDCIEKLKLGQIEAPAADSFRFSHIL